MMHVITGKGSDASDDVTYIRHHLLHHLTPTTTTPPTSPGDATQHPPH